MPHPTIGEVDPTESDPAPSTRERPGAGALISTGFAALTRPPFRSLWFLVLLVALASATIAPGTDDLAIAGTLVLAGISLYLDIATILAAGDAHPEKSVDHWVRAAFRRRCFWRFFITGVLTDLSVAIGLLGLVVGGWIVGSIIGVAPQAVVLERHLPVQALARSAELTRPARAPVGIVFGLLVLLPTITFPALYLLGITTSTTAQVITGVLAATIGTASTISLTRAFVLLGGGVDEPAPEEPEVVQDPPGT